MTGTVKIFYLKGGNFMGATQKTTHYDLPIYASGDETGWLSGFNPAMQAIDTALFNINQTAEDANGTAVGAKASAQQAISSAQATANLLAQTNNTVTSLVNKLTFSRLEFARPNTGAIIIGETNSDNSITNIMVNLSATDGLPSTYTVNGTKFHEFGNCTTKLCNNVLSGSESAGFTGTMKQIGYISISTGGKEKTTGFSCFYDNASKKTRFGVITNSDVSVNSTGSSNANITFTNIQTF